MSHGRGVRTQEPVAPAPDGAVGVIVTFRAPQIPSTNQWPAGTVIGRGKGVMATAVCAVEVAVTAGRYFASGTTCVGMDSIRR